MKGDGRARGGKTVRGLGSAVLGAGCVLGTLGSCSHTPPTEERPPVEVPEAFSETGDEPLPERWWESFDDPSLDALVAEALAGNMDWLQAWDRLDQARALGRRAGAELLPEVTGTAGAAETFADEDEVRGSEFSLGLTVNWEVDIRGRLRALREAARADARAEEQAVEATAVRLAAAVASVWYQLVEAREQLEILDEQIATNERIARVVSLRFQNGTARAQEVLRQRQFAEGSRGDRIRVRSRVELLEQQLAILVGRPPGSDVTGPDSELIPLPPLIETGLPAELIRRRPDVREAFLRVRAANARVGAAIADRFPRVSLSATADTGGGDVGDLFSGWLANLVGNLTVPVLDAGRRVAEVDRARAAASEAVHAYGQTVLLALGEVESALTRERHQRELLTNLDEQVRLITRALERGRAAYANGATDFLDVLDLLSTQQALVRDRLVARRELILARVDLCSALAGGWAADRPQAGPENLTSNGARGASGTAGGA